MSQSTLLIRKDTKQAWSSATKMEMKDDPKRLSEYVDHMNEVSGWRKYDVLEDAA